MMLSMHFATEVSNVPSNFFKECAQKYIHVQILHFFQKYVRSHASGRADYIIHCTTSFPTIKLHEKLAVTKYICITCVVGISLFYFFYLQNIHY